MTEQFKQDEVYSGSWINFNKEKSLKLMNFTVSDVSKDDFFKDLFANDDQQGWNQEEFNKKAQTKLRNKINAKNHREHKKKTNEELLQRLESLQNENNRLKKEKYCKWCQRSFNYVKCKEQISHTKMQEQRYFADTDKNTRKTPTDIMEFQKPDLMKLNKRQLKNGKIWIALGVLMLILGLHIHGLHGSSPISQQIQINRKESARWINQLESKSNKDYFNVKMRFKQQKIKGGKTKESPQSQIKIKYYDPNSLHGLEKEEEIGINPQLLYSIQAEFDDIGRYI